MPKDSHKTVLCTMRRINQQLGWGPFMTYVVGILGEQIDESRTERSMLARNEVRRILRDMQPLFEACSNHSYSSELTQPDDPTMRVIKRVLAKHWFRLEPKELKQFQALLSKVYPNKREENE